MKNFGWIYSNTRVFVLTSILLVLSITISSNDIIAIKGQLQDDDRIDEDIQVLILNAYHRGYGWADSQTDGVLDVFIDESEGVTISVEYLDWKRYPDEALLRQEYEIMAYKYDNVTFDIVIGMDDIGMQFAIDYRDELFPGVPIVFSGVFEDSAKRRSEGVEAITGVIEKIDPYGTVEIILSTYPSVEHIYVMNDTSETGIDVQNSILKAVEAYSDNYTYETLNDYTYEELIELLRQPKPNSVIFMGTYNLDASGRVIPNELFCQQLAEKTPIPIYTTYEYLFGYGVVGGSLLSGYLQGERAAEIALEILKGRDVDDIPIDTVATVYNGFDYKYIMKHNIGEGLLPKDYVMINKPESVFEKYKEVILTTIGIIIMLIVFVVALLLNIRRRHITQKQLDKEHLELMETYKVLADSEEELIAQNTELIYHQEEINRMLHHDYLTGIANRLSLSKSFNEIKKTALKRNEYLLLALVDIDNFNYINTAYGNKVGDQMLKAIAMRINKVVGQAGMLARIGGDEFVFLGSVACESMGNELCLDICSVFDDSFRVDSNYINVTATVGYVLGPIDGNQYDDLLNKADIAKTEGKTNRNIHLCRFEKNMIMALEKKIRISHELPKGIKNEEFYVKYQPQYSCASNNVSGFEALVRWESSTLGEVGPSEFVPIAEKTGDIIEIGWFVMKDAIAFHRELLEVGLDNVKIAINLSVAQIQQHTFAREVIDLFIKEDVSPIAFELEVTESIFIDTFKMINEQLLELKASGFAIALDDFGTGYSSLTYLKSLPITTLKIDKNFIDDILQERDKHFMTKSIIELAHKLGYRVVAEGVEEEVQAEYLRACQCEDIQGYLYGKPQRKEAFLLTK